MQTRTLGRNGAQVSALGVGCMSMSAVYGPPADHTQMIALIRHAVDQGVARFDTAESCGPFTNERLVGEGLALVRDRVVIATKFGFDIDLETDACKGGTNSRPEHIKAVADACLCLKRLGTDRIDIFYQHRAAPNAASPATKRVAGASQGYSAWISAAISSARCSDGIGTRSTPSDRFKLHEVLLGQVRHRGSSRRSSTSRVAR